MHQKRLSNRVFIDDDNIVGHCCFYWNRLMEMSWGTMRIARHGRAHRF